MTTGFHGHERVGYGRLGWRTRILGLLKALSKQRVRQRWRQDREIALIARSGLFDAAHYLSCNPDVASAGVDPVVHYVRCGAGEGRSPNPEFDTGFYRAANPDVGRAGMNPFAHYVVYGKTEGLASHARSHLPNQPDRPRSDRVDQGSALEQCGPESHGVTVCGRILVVDQTVPTPDRDSGSQDTVNLMRLLRGQGYHVTFLPGTLAEHPLYTAALRHMGIECLHRPKVTDLVAACRAMSPCFDAVIICRQPVAAQVLRVVKSAAPKVPVIFNTIDLHHLRMEREAALIMDQAGQHRAAEIRRSELDLIARADATLVVSRHELDLLRARLPLAKVHHIPIIRQCPKGQFPGFHDRQAVVFMGGFRHPPNQDAVRFLLGEVWPRARDMGLTAPLHIIGSDIPAFVRDDPSADVRVVGHVPDLRDVFTPCRVSIAPIRYGAGLKGKVIDSLLHHVPVVATSAAVEGSGLEDGRHVLVADDADGLARALVRLHGSPQLWQGLAEAGQSACREMFGLEPVDTALRELFASLGLPKAGRASSALP